MSIKEIAKNGVEDFKQGFMAQIEDDHSWTWNGGYWTAIAGLAIGRGVKPIPALALSSAGAVLTMGVVAIGMGITSVYVNGLCDYFEKRRIESKEVEA